VNQKESLTKDSSLPKLILTGEEKWASFRFFRGFPEESFSGLLIAVEIDMLLFAIM